MSKIPTHLKDLVKRGSFGEFRSLELARQCVAHCAKPHWIVMGDCDEDGGVFWVVLPADAARLERAGYEMTW